MKLSEIMTRDVIIMQPDDSLQSAAKKMRDLNIGFLPVFCLCLLDILSGCLTLLFSRHMGTSYISRIEPNHNRPYEKSNERQR